MTGEVVRLSPGTDAELRKIKYSIFQKTGIKVTKQDIVGFCISKCFADCKAEKCFIKWLKAYIIFIEERESVKSMSLIRTQINGNDLWTRQFML